MEGLDKLALTILFFKLSGLLYALRWVQSILLTSSSPYYPLPSNVSGLLLIYQVLKETTKIVILVDCLAWVNLIALALGVALAFLMAPSIIAGLYSLAMSISFSSSKRLCLVSGFVKIRLIPIKSENGILVVQ